MRPRHVAVVDIGKTNAKAVLVDMATLGEGTVRRTSNRVLTDGPYPHYDHRHLWRFVLDSLAALNREAPIDAISVAAHGATAALIDADGGLALPILDYEHDGPDATAAAYDALRPAFAETGTPRLPGGLNIGAQLFWQEKTFPEAFAGARFVLPYPQYWSFRLSGVPAAEMTSLGAHSDLWNPFAQTFSSLVGTMGWQRLMAPLHHAFDTLGAITAPVASTTGVAPDCRVLCGIHDSNASLLPHLIDAKPPFSVVSTGTWVIAMAIGGRKAVLDPEHDTLVNVDAFGDPVPSARFMGGREFALVLGDRPAEASDADLSRIVERGVMLLPTVQPGAGPYREKKARWIGEYESLTPSERTAAVSAYLALMTATCLDLVGAEGPTRLEGPFSGNRVFVRTLAATTKRPVLTGAPKTTGTSLGAALLADLAAGHVLAETTADTDDTPDEALDAYAARWFALAAAG